jgi:hypothetical protein
VRHIDLIVHGTVGSESGSAMARTVSLPMAIAAKMLLNGNYPDIQSCLHHSGNRFNMKARQW